MQAVNKQQFDDYISSKNLKVVPGETFNSHNYINELGEIKAYTEISSWCPVPTYVIDISEQEYTCYFITDLINLKQT